LSDYHYLVFGYDRVYHVLKFITKSFIALKSE
jgi:hypothetical protein